MYCYCRKEAGADCPVVPTPPKFMLSEEARELFSRPRKSRVVQEKIEKEEQPEEVLEEVKAEELVDEEEREARNKIRVMEDALQANFDYLVEQSGAVLWPVLPLKLF